MPETQSQVRTEQSDPGVQVHLEHPKRTFGRVVLDFLNPGYHFRRLKEDMVATKAALQKRKELLAGSMSHAELPEVFRGKLMGVFFATGWTNMVGIGLGYVAQKMFSNAWVGLLSTPILCYVMTAIGFQVGWWIDNMKIYQGYKKDPAHQFFELQKDMWPVHQKAFSMAVVFTIVNVGFASPILAALTFFAPNVAKEIPAGMLIMIGEFLFIAGSFVRVMGDFFDKHSYKLAMKYRAICANCESGAESE